MYIQKGKFVRTKEGDFGRITEIIKEGTGVRCLGEDLKDKIIIIETPYIKNLRISEDQVKMTSKSPIKLLEKGDFINNRQIRYIEQNEAYGNIALIYFNDSEFFETVDISTSKKVNVVFKEKYEKNIINFKNYKDQK